MKDLVVVRQEGNDKRRINVCMAFPEEKFKDKGYTLDSLKISIYNLYCKYTKGNTDDAK